MRVPGGKPRSFPLGDVALSRTYRDAQCARLKIPLTPRVYVRPESCPQREFPRGIYLTMKRQRSGHSVPVLQVRCCVRAGHDWGTSRSLEKHGFQGALKELKEILAEKRREIYGVPL